MIRSHGISKMVRTETRPKRNRRRKEESKPAAPEHKDVCLTCKLPQCLLDTRGGLVETNKIYCRVIMEIKEAAK